MVKLERDKVCIVGCAGGREKAPFDDDSFEFWGVNNLYLHLPIGVMAQRKWKWFEIHPIDYMADKKQWTRRWNPVFRGQNCNDYIAGLAKLNVPILMQKEWVDIPTSVQYPYDEIRKKYRNYFTNTVTYEILLAIELGAKEIHLYGIDMAVSSKTLDVLTDEYAGQRPSCEWALGVAEGRGIKVVVPPFNDLLKTLFQYAYEERPKSDFDSKLDVVMNSILSQRANADGGMDNAKTAYNQAIGAIHALKNLANEKEKHEKLDEIINTYIGQLDMQAKQAKHGIEINAKKLEQFKGAETGIKEVSRLWLNIQHTHEGAWSNEVI